MRSLPIITTILFLSKMRGRLYAIYKKLYHSFGPQHWWPGQTPFEVMVGAILTQGTNWSNVEKAINNLKKRRLLSAKKLYSLPPKKLASLIRPAGYFNVKASRLREFLKFFIKNRKKLAGLDIAQLRPRLLAVRGIGPETADSIMLYALDRPVFVVDAYTKRILLRHKMISVDTTYDQMQGLFMRNLKHDLRLFNEYHALLVRLGKDYCLKSKPRCAECPLKNEKSNIKYQKYRRQKNA